MLPAGDCVSPSSREADVTMAEGTLTAQTFSRRPAIPAKLGHVPEILRPEATPGVETAPEPHVPPASRA